MTNILIAVVAFTVSFFVLIAVHEFGHFLAGWLGGIPARDMRIRLFVFPQHVDFRHENRWICYRGDPELYVAAMIRLLVTTPRCYFYVCGGFLVETLFSVAVIPALVESGFREVGYLVALSTCILYGFYLLYDVPATLISKFPRGDTSGLWSMAKLPTALLVLGLVSVRVLLMWYAAQHRLTTG